MTPPEPRRPIYAQISQSAYEGWQTFCDRYGVTMTSVIDVMGKRVHESVLVETDQLLSVIEEARLLDRERRSRRKRRGRQPCTDPTGEG